MTSSPLGIAEDSQHHQNSSVHGQSHFIFSSLIKLHVDKQHVNMTKASHSQTVFSLTVVSGLICVAVDPCFCNTVTDTVAGPANKPCLLSLCRAQLTSALASCVFICWATRLIELAAGSADLPGWVAPPRPPLALSPSGRAEEPPSPDRERSRPSHLFCRWRQEVRPVVSCTRPLTTSYF